jgi:D-methionine transport system substrate-binding protein
MKKYLLNVIAILTIFVNFVYGADKVLKVGASPVPHAEILNLIKDDLAKEGIDLEVIEYTDYVTPNLSLDDGSIDANYFQNTPYLNTFTKEHKLKNKLVPLAPVHIEPLGLYSDKIKDIKELKNGASIAIPNDPTNEGRALLLLQAKGLITLKKSDGILATTKSIIKNSKNLKFREIDAAQLPRVIGDFDAVVINGNYALEAKLSPAKDAILLEDHRSPYANLVTVRKGSEKDVRIIALEKAIHSKKVKDFIDKKYDGGVIAVFK